MKIIKYISGILLITLSFGFSCKKNMNETPTNATNMDTVAQEAEPVDSPKIIREYYTSNRTDLFVFYNGEEHKADYAVFNIVVNPGYPLPDYFAVKFPASHHEHSDYCLELSDGKTSQNIGEPHLVNYLELWCDHVGGSFGVVNGYRLVVTKLTQDSISGYFWYESSSVGACGAFNNVPIVR